MENKDTKDNLLPTQGERRVITNPQVIYPNLPSGDIRTAKDAENYKKILTGLEKQQFYLFCIQNAPLICPVCGESHCWNELIFKDEKCGDVELSFDFTLFSGGQFLAIKKAEL